VHSRLTPARPAAVLFDMDGTLVDTEHLWWLAVAEIADGLGYRLTDDDLPDVLGRPVAHTAGYLHGIAGPGVSEARISRDLDTAFDSLAERYWPGPLTLVVKAGSKLPLRVTANTGNVALRVPEAAIPRAIVAALGLPITATSANLSGMPECTYANGVREQLGDKIPLIVDGGPTARTVATTIVDLSGGGNSWMILREGAIPTHEIALILQR